MLATQNRVVNRKILINAEAAEAQSARRNCCLIVPRDNFDLPRKTQITLRYMMLINQIKIFRSHYVICGYKIINNL